jgi:hypothetical protein
MHDPAPAQKPESPKREPESPEMKADPKPRELGGPPGPEPTRYGDWEKAGRCIDF